MKQRSQLIAIIVVAFAGLILGAVGAVMSWPVVMASAIVLFVVSGAGLSRIARTKVRSTANHPPT